MVSYPKSLLCVLIISIKSIWWQNTVEKTENCIWCHEVTQNVSLMHVIRAMHAPGCIACSRVMSAASCESACRQLSCILNWSRSSECISSMTLWCTMSDYTQQRANVQRAQQKHIELEKPAFIRLWRPTLAFCVTCDLDLWPFDTK